MRKASLQGYGLCHAASILLEKIYMLENSLVEAERVYLRVVSSMTRERWVGQAQSRLVGLWALMQKPDKEIEAYIEGLKKGPDGEARHASLLRLYERGR